MFPLAPLALPLAQLGGDHPLVRVGPLQQSRQHGSDLEVGPWRSGLEIKSLRPEFEG